MFARQRTFHKPLTTRSENPLYFFHLSNSCPISFSCCVIAQSFSQTFIQFFGINHVLQPFSCRPCRHHCFRHSSQCPPSFYMVIANLERSIQNWHTIWHCRAYRLMESLGHKLICLHCCCHAQRPRHARFHQQRRARSNRS